MGGRAEVAEYGVKGRSGFFGHAGRPGKVGGSVPAGTGPRSSAGQDHYLTSLKGVYRNYSGRDFSEPTGRDREIIEGTLRGVRETFPSLAEVPFSIAFNSGHGPPGSWGYTTKPPASEDPILFLYGTEIEKALRGDSFKRYEVGKTEKARRQMAASEIARWTGMTEPVTYELVLEHVVAHEVGHRWWRNRVRVEKSEWTNERGERQVRVKSTTYEPVIESWKQFYTTHPNVAVSGYGRSIFHDTGGTSEAFADAFANFATGQTLEPEVESWFMENAQ